jgi:hypothetical protein
MEISEIAGHDEVLGSLTAGPKPESDEYVSLPIYPAHRYSTTPGSDVVLWYKATLTEEFQRLRALVKKSLVKSGLGSSPRFADAAILAYAVTKPATNPAERLRRILASTTECDLSQFFIIPSSSFFALWGDAERRPSMSIGELRFGPFLHAPLSGELLATAKYRIAKTGIISTEHTESLDRRIGTICIARDPRSIRVLDFDQVNIKGRTDVEVQLLNYYFDDVAEFWFEEFWREHLEYQVSFVASGADVLDRSSLYGLPGYSELSIFLGGLNGRGGTVSMIEETRHIRDSIAKRFYNFTQDIKRFKERWASEFDNQAVLVPYSGSLVNLARYMARSREMKQRGSTDEAFVLLITGLEALMADGDDSITRNISRRIASIISLTDKTPIEVVRKDIARLYTARSRFVHGAISVDPSLLPDLEKICERVYFTALRSKILAKNQSNDNWRDRWLAMLDYLFGACSVGLVPEDSALLESGIRSGSLEPEKREAITPRYPKMQQSYRFGDFDRTE